MKLKKKYIILSILLIILLICFGAYKLMKSREYQLMGNLIYKVNTNDKIVYLTFDDGPTEQTDQILKTLDELDVKATFFLIGSQIEENMIYAKAIVENGHDIGNHTYSHKRMVLKTPKFVEEEIDKTNHLIKNIGYDKEILFRPPYGKRLLILPFYLNKINQTTAMWNMEPESYEETSISSQTMAKYVVDNVESGSIILLHPMNDSTDKTIEAIRLIVTELKEKGYSFGLLSDRSN